MNGYGTSLPASETDRLRAEGEIVFGHCMHGGHDDDGSGHTLDASCVDPWPVRDATIRGTHYNVGGW